jgi:hypothetical protein
MINMLTLRPGDRLESCGKIVAEVTENMEDGMWLQVRYVEVPEHPDQTGMVELCHAQDIVRLLTAPA